MAKLLRQIIQGGGESVCGSCIHHHVCRLIDNQPCVKCASFLQKPLWFEDKESTDYVLLQEAIQARPEFLNEGQEDYALATYARGWNKGIEAYRSNLVHLERSYP